MRLNGQNISPKSFLAELSRQSVSQTPFQNPEDFEILRVRAIGTSSGQFLEKILDCEMRGQNGLSAGALGVGIPAAIAAVMILKRQTSLSSGVTAPENALRQNIFFSALRASRAFQFMETRIKAV